VVGICYEAIDAPYTDPERQIKSYLRWLRMRRVLGQQADEELRLPS
jgi:hypothetical protein